MDYLDQLSKEIEDGMRDFKDAIRERASGIELEDVLKKLEGKTPSEHNEQGWFIFKIGAYEIHVSDEQINLFGHGVVDRQFEGEEVRVLYNKLKCDYAEKERERVEAQF